MRPLLLALLSAAAAFGQSFHFGIKGGVPLTDFIDTASSAAYTVPNRYIVGATAELRLPWFGLAIEGDALYRHINYTAKLSNVTDRTTASAWEFPLLLKYRFPTPLVRPYVSSGVAWDTLSGVTETISGGLANNTTTGFVIGAGVDVHALVIHVSPEIRYTRWASPHFNLNGILNSNQNQAEFLVGFTF